MQSGTVQKELLVIIKSIGVQRYRNPPEGCFSEDMMRDLFQKIQKENERKQKEEIRKETERKQREMK